MPESYYSSYEPFSCGNWKKEKPKEEFLLEGVSTFVDNYPITSMLALLAGSTMIAGTVNTVRMRRAVRVGVDSAASLTAESKRRRQRRARKH